jgi:N6-adenosine-specific RNA methylase IME4
MRNGPERIEQLRVEAIFVGERLRALSESAVALLTHSLQTIGLVHPITIYRHNGSATPRLVSGAHRLAAAKAIGWETIPCVVAPSDDADMRALIEIDENLQRSDLTAAERAMHVSKRKEIYERLHPETRNGENQHTRVRKVCEPSGRFTEETAARTGKSERSIQLDAMRAAAIPQIAETIGTCLDIGEELDALAKLPHKRQAEIIAKAKSEPKTKSKRKRTVSAKGEAKKMQRDKRERELADSTERASKAVGSKLYGVIYADPPWKFETFSHRGMDRSADNHYPTMTVEEIANLRIPAAEDCVLFLWATAPMVPQAINVLHAWGFEYRSCCVWVKDRPGTGYWFRNQHELLLVGVKGSIPAPAPGTQYSSVITAPVGEHSEKPACFAEMIEELFPNTPALEMFARAPRLGWDVWGNQADAA